MSVTVTSAGQGLAEVIRRNLPANKPQLWENFGLCLRRKTRFTAAQFFSKGWTDAPHVVQLSEGDLRMEVVPRDIIGRYIYMFGVWEIVGTRLVQALLEPGMTFVDVGANAGYYSLLASRLVGPNGSIYSFEPHDGLRARLARNVALNDLNNVVIRPEAVAGASGSVSFYPVSQADNQGTSSLLPGEGRQEWAVKVPAISLDDFVSSLGDGRVDVIKIDVEGAEAEVFAGMQRVLAGPCAPLALLFESDEVAPHQAMLESLGYTVRAVHYSLGGGLEFVAPGDSQRLRDRRRDFAGQGTLDYVAMREHGCRRSLEALSARSQRPLPAALRLLSHRG